MRARVTGNKAALERQALMTAARPPTPIATGDNRATIGRRAPLGLSVADRFEPRLTLLAQPCEVIGRRAAASLAERIASSEGERRTIRLGAALRARDSRGPPA